ncbi:MAG: hypothetical protein C4K49_09325 [Candidatus Thorarchaeota archaeon]|nr:MAG: hypothetical protein C4K49_09325 [Candidatus Thorarchaeota archaeon]
MSISASKCKSCDRTVIPPRTICPYCGPKAGDMSQITVGEEGTVLSYTLSQMPPEGFDPPILLALVQLQHNAVVLCLGNPEDSSRIQIDKRVKVLSGDDGRFHFSPVEI